MIITGSPFRSPCRLPRSPHTTGRSNECQAGSLRGEHRDNNCNVSVDCHQRDHAAASDRRDNSDHLSAQVMCGISRSLTLVPTAGDLLVNLNDDNNLGFNELYVGLDASRREAIMTLAAASVWRPTNAYDFYREYRRMPMF